MEKSKDGFSCWIEELAIISAGRTWEDLKSEFKQGLKSHLEVMKDLKEDIPGVFKQDYKLVFTLNTNQFFDYYDVFNKTKLAERIGLSYNLLLMYNKGIKKPSEKQSLKIINGINDFAKELIIS